MPPSKPPGLAKSLLSAEDRAYQGKNDSQESQAVLLALYAEHGIGLTSSSPAPETAGDSTRQHSGIEARVSHLIPPPPPLKDSKAAEPAGAPGQNASTNLRSRRDPKVEASGHTEPEADCTNHRSKPSAPQSSVAEPDDSNAPAGASSADAHVVAQPRHHTNWKDAVPTFPTSIATLKTVPAKRKTKTMDVSQSPTQSNHGRSYDQYQDARGLTSSQPKDHDTRDGKESQMSRASSSHEHRTLHEDDAGAVKFNLNLYKPQSESQISQDQDDFLPLPQATSSMIFAPETPAVTSRPFAHQGQVLQLSQLFAQTQYTSAIKNGRTSPTSSRPSPDLFNHNTISPNNIISSPLKDRGLRTSPPGATSSPLLPSTASRVDDEPREIGSTVPESPQFGPRKTRAAPEPIDSYDPSSRPVSAVPNSREDGGVYDDEDDDEDDLVARRRHIARLRQAKATKSLTNISLPRLSSDDTRDIEVEVPSTAKNQREAAEYLEQCHRGYRSDSTTAETVADSQERITTTGNANPRPDTLSTKEGNDVVESENAVHEEIRGAEIDGSNKSKETIPETSPPATKGTPAVRNSIDPSISLPEIINTRRSTRLNDASVPKSSSPPQPPLSAVSSLTTLSATPDISSSTTPDTHYAEETADKIVSSPAAAKVQRHLRLSSSLKTYSTSGPKKRGSSSRLKRQSSVSTDELAQPSSSATAPETISITTNKTGRISRSLARNSMILRDTPNTSLIKEPPARSGIFQGMVFAVSFQTQQPRDMAADQVKSVKKAIEDAGGQILNEGFSELFEDMSPLTPLKLNAAALNTGFTALIADGHSRKVKYMQALALGIPCLAWQWVTACAAKNTLLDWSPYVLCAGQSRVLGDAIRSRTLPIYDAKSITLEKIIANRPKILDTTEILAILGNSRKTDEKMPYVFLMQVLGATLVKVNSLKEARAKLREKESSRPFDLVYMDEHVASDVDALFGQVSELTGSKKRKRQSASSKAVDDRGPPPKKVKTLTDEVVVQSLLLGRLVEEGEME